MARDHVIGLHAAKQFLEKNPASVVRAAFVVGNKSAKIEALKALCHENSIPFDVIKKHAMEQMIGDEVHQGVMLEIQAKPKKSAQSDDLMDIAMREKPLILILDTLTDPHNVGACLRSAEAAGVDAVVIPKHKSCPINQTVRKVACGAADMLPIFTVSNLANTLKSLQKAGVWIVGMAGEAATPLYDSSLDGFMTDSLALIVGSEGKGMRKLTRDFCDALVSIPMQGQMESLNVSVATGITLFEIARRRHHAN